jgi:hypothetical protein
VPKGHPVSVKALLRDLASAVQEVDDLKRDLRKAKRRVTELMNKLDVRVDSARFRRKRGPAA